MPELNNNLFLVHNQAMRTPSRDATGIGLLYEYYNQLYFFERRFFSPERGLGVFFDWYVCFSLCLCVWLDLTKNVETMFGNLICKGRTGA